MNFEALPLDGAYRISASVSQDQRGYFARVFCNNELKNYDLNFTIQQINRSLTKQSGTIRGLHFQHKPKEEAKIVQCIRGSVFDVIVDLRKDSPTYKQWHSEILTEKELTMIYIPKGFAHGFQTREDNTELLYCMSEFYSPEHATGIRWNDPSLNIEWPIPEPILSEKDQTLPYI